MDDMTPDEFCEFMSLIRDLRFNGVDTKPEEVNNKAVRLAWRSVRPVVLKSTSNAKDYENKKKPKEKKQEEPAKPVEAVKVLPTVTIPAAQTMDYDDYLEELSKVEDTKGKQSRERMMNDTYYPYGAFERVYNDYIAYRTNG